MKKSTNVLPELSWRTKQNAVGTRASDDVSITIIKAKGEKRRLSITFRNGLYKVFESYNIVFALLKNRMYFKGVDRRDGYTISIKNTSGYACATLSNDEVLTYEEFIGDYSLKYDEFYELYYIEKG